MKHLLITAVLVAFITLMNLSELEKIKEILQSYTTVDFSMAYVTINMKVY
jgi:hypothetical protein